MKLSEQVAAFVARQEGFVSKAFRDPVEIWTIGTCFTNRSRVFSEYWRKLHGRPMRAGDCITPDQNAVILRKAADEEYGAAVNRHIKPRNQHQHDGATSVCFNCEPGAAKWKWAKLLAAGNVSRSGVLLRTTAVTARGNRLRGLVRHRAEEADLIENGNYGRHAAPRHERVLSPKHSDEVTEYPQKLIKLGYKPGKVNGIYGTETRNAVRRFQANHPDLKIDGILGKANIAQIDRSPSKRSEPKAVAAGVTVTGAGAVAAALEFRPIDHVGHRRRCRGCCGGSGRRYLEIPKRPLMSAITIASIAGMELKFGAPLLAELLRSKVPGVAGKALGKIAERLGTNEDPVAIEQAIPTRPDVFQEIKTQDHAYLARISQSKWGIGPKNLVNFFCNKELSDLQRGSDANTLYLRTDRI